MLALFLIISGLMASVNSQATSFARVSIPQQLAEADSVIIGHYLEEKSIQIEDGTIATQMVIKLSQEFGLNSELLGLEEVYLHYPGGSWNGERTFIEGTPRFIVGERVAILARHIDNRLWGLNLALGSFKVLSYGKETLLVNGVFPEDPELGQIAITDFENMVKEVKGSSLKWVKAHQSMNEKLTSKGKNRSIASIDTIEENESETSSQPGPFWLLVFLAVAGAFTRYRVKRSRR